MLMVTFILVNGKIIIKMAKVNKPMLLMANVTRVVGVIIKEMV